MAQHQQAYLGSLIESLFTTKTHTRLFRIVGCEKGKTLRDHLIQNVLLRKRELRQERGKDWSKIIGPVILHRLVHYTWGK